MDNTKHGGPAFPLTDAQSVHRIGAAAIEGITDSAERDRLYIEATARACAGMTLRDYFAAKALTGMLAEPLSDDTDPSSIFFTPNFHGEHAQPGDRIAAAAYVLADAMLRARGAA
ncbi:TPA: hypothetical protein SAY52_005492 [Burkholderia cenocepacia]|uniref:hypothetical protein n=1 Tax=unclassified Burkholderia TaxID=2613784 RepID=UPI00158DE1E0|nr:MULTISPECIES: hypothetical protein [unclassified Burkholderia]HEF5874813.1 hypothetical protein [Burkholderia cenocepacia]